MASPIADVAVASALRVGHALLKFVSPNDAGVTGSHQRGPYLPKPAWRLFSPRAPERGVNFTHHVRVTWHDGNQTRSRVKWYGQLTRSEFRLTSFGRGAPYFREGSVGDLFVLVPESPDQFHAFLLSSEEDIEEAQAALGLRVSSSWAEFTSGGRAPETEDECLDRHFQAFANALRDFPPAIRFSTGAWETLVDCARAFRDATPDEKLVRALDAEYTLFKVVERKICEPEIQRAFATIDGFLSTAMSIIQRRKARAGRSLENHVEHLLRDAEIPFAARKDVEGTKPDIIIPGVREYNDRHYPLRKLFAVGLKTTCKDRWRQVLREAPRVTAKHLLTVQNGISEPQLREMAGAGLTLIVPERLHREYPPVRGIRILTVGRFIDDVRAALAQ